VGPQRRRWITTRESPFHLTESVEGRFWELPGDALTAEGGHLNGPNPPLTLDVREAARSVRRLADLEIDTIVCYHGGVVGEDANGQLHRVIQEASGERAK
jgi:hypothetical protein